MKYFIKDIQIGLKSKVKQITEISIWYSKLLIIPLNIPTPTNIKLNSPASDKSAPAYKLFCHESFNSLNIKEYISVFIKKIKSERDTIREKFSSIKFISIKRPIVMKNKAMKNK